MSNRISSETSKFISLIKQRSCENKKAFDALYQLQLYGNCLSVVRQELDSLIRVIYLLTIPDLHEREVLIHATLNGEKWKRKNSAGKMIIITDKEMVELSEKLNGWTLSVYKFGCSFIHLSQFHDYHIIDPLNALSEIEKENIINHINYYHGASLNIKSTINDVIPYLGNILEKIKSNLECYLNDLGAGNIVHI